MRGAKMKLSEITEILKSVGPMLWKAFKRGQLFNPACELTEPNPDILCEYDVKIPISEGFSVTANIFRSKNAEETGEKVPVVDRLLYFKTIRQNVTMKPLSGLRNNPSVLERWDSLRVGTHFSHFIPLHLGQCLSRQPLYANRSCKHAGSLHRSLCPPSSDVRQLQLAVITFF